MYFLFIFCKILDVFFFDGCFNIESKVEIGFLYKEYQICDCQFLICDSEFFLFKYFLFFFVVDNEVGMVVLFGVFIVCLYVENREWFCLVQIFNILFRNFSYNEIYNC